MLRVEKQKKGRRITRTSRERVRARWFHLEKLKPRMRVYRLHPDPNHPAIVEVRLARTRHQMAALCLRYEGAKFEPPDQRCMGRCRSYFNRVRREHPTITISGQIVARVYLNANDTHWLPAEIPSHELGHAAMAWARFRKADLSQMEGEEVMCHALGRMIQTLNYRLYRIGFYDGRL